MTRHHSALIVLSIIGWGFLTENILNCILMGMTIMIFALMPFRWKISDRQFQSIADLTSLSFVLSSLYIFYSYGHQAIYQILLTIPYCGYPLIMLQQASVNPDIPMSAFNYKLRKGSGLVDRVNITPHYILCCLLSSSTAEDGLLCLIFTFLLFIGYLTSIRIRHSKRIIFAVLTMVGILSAFWTTHFFLPTYNVIVEKIAGYISPNPWWVSDPNRFLTSIGQIRLKKLSDRIRVRIEAGINENSSLPIYLTQSIFDRYDLGGIWTIDNKMSLPIDKTLNSTQWLINPDAVDDSGIKQRLTITMKSDKDLFRMPVPSRTISIHSKDLVDLSRNQYMNLTGEAKPGHITFEAMIGSIDLPPPVFEDLTVPYFYKGLFNRIQEDIGIDSASSDHDKIKLLKSFLAQEYAYSYPASKKQNTRNTLANFLVKSKKGHCEHFATATALILRNMGIPTKYVVGYLVSEWSELESRLIARDRHAHAWTIAFVDGIWVVLDLTPPNWEKEEAELMKTSRTIRDMTSYFFYNLNTFTIRDHKYFKTTLYSFMALLIVILTFRLVRSPHLVRKEYIDHDNDIFEKHIEQIGRIVNKLKRIGLERTESETLQMLLYRSHALGLSKQAIDNLIKTYYRVRFSQQVTEFHRRTLESALNEYNNELDKTN